MVAGSASRNLTILMGYLFFENVSIGFIFPLLGPLFYDDVNGLFNPTYSQSIRQILFGVLLTATATATLITAPFWGMFSDKFGRKPILLIGVSLLCIGFFLSGVSTLYKNYILFFLGQLIVAASIGTGALVFAAIIDTSTEESKPKNIGKIGISICLGMLTGPLLSGVLSSISLLHLSKFTLPFYCVTLLCILNLSLVALFFDPSFHPIKSTEHSKSQTIKNRIFNLVFGENKNIRLILLIFFIYICGFEIFFNYSVLFLVTVHHFSSVDISTLMVIVMIGYILNLSLIYPLMVEKINIISLMKYCFVTVSVFFTIMLFFLNNVMFYVFLFIIFNANGILNSVFFLHYTDMVPENTRGLAMGILGSMNSMTTALAGGLIACFSAIPYLGMYLMAALWIIIATLLLTCSAYPKKLDRN
jgi:predicted MFS family arabinose efflux permease